MWFRKLTSRRRTNSCQRPHYRGTILIYTLIGMVAFTGFVSLGVDLSHVLLVKNELQFAADAAARYGAAGIATSVSTAQSNAVFAAGEMHADGSPVVVNPATDLAFGTWSNNTFTPLTGSAQSGANAIKVTCHHTAAGGNPVPLYFADVLGMSSADVTAFAIAQYTPPNPVGIIGLNSVSMSGSALVDSHNSQSGPYSANSSTQNGLVISNGSIALSGGAEILGNAEAGPGYSTTGGIVTGSRASQSSPITCPPVSVGSNATTNNDSAVAPYMSGNNFTVGSGSVTMPAGTYCFGNFTMSGSSVLNIGGPVAIYVTGTLTLSGSVYTAQTIPSNLKIFVASTSQVTLSGSSALYGEIYAPQAPVTISGSGGLYGSCVGATLNITSGAAHYDQSIGGSSSLSVSIVQ